MAEYMLYQIVKLSFIKTLRLKIFACTLDIRTV